MLQNSPKKSFATCNQPTVPACSETLYILCLDAINIAKKCTKMFFIVGDSGYSLRPWMLTPITDAAQNSPEALYNRKQMTCRSLIEQCNGVLKMRFRCLLKHRVLHYSPPIASKIIYTCAVLHNICISENVPMLLELNDGNEEFDFGMNINGNVNANEENNVPERNIRRINPDLAAGRIKQQQIITNYFS